MYNSLLITAVYIFSWRQSGFSPAITVRDSLPRVGNLCQLGCTGYRVRSGIFEGSAVAGNGDRLGRKVLVQFGDASFYVPASPEHLVDIGRSGHPYPAYRGKSDIVLERAAE